MAAPSLLRSLCIAPLFLLSACISSELGPYEDHDESEDYVEIAADIPGISSTFNKNNVLSDEMFTNTTITAQQMQAFLENAPYFGGMRSWLADHTSNGVRASEALVAAARAENINPLMLLARMQVEKSVVSKRERPSQRTRDYTMGCGCPDNRACNPEFKGFDKQMACAARTMRRHFDGSENGTGQWRKQKSRKTLDPIRVTPANHATASLYAYTPWVLTGRGGNWLVWNVTKKYAAAMASIQPTDPNPTPDPTQPDPDPTQPDPTPGGDKWVGSTCQANAECDLSSGGVSNGECVNWFDEEVSTLFGFCSMDCQGFCKDKSGENPTFCAQVMGQGQCVAVAGSENSNCTAIPGTVKAAVKRHVGSSGASSSWKDVCVPKHEAIQCTAAAGDGYCVNTSTTSCSGTLATGACPGANSIRCCID